MAVMLSRRAALVHCGVCVVAVAGCTSYGSGSQPEPAASAPTGGQSSVGGAGGFETSAADIPVGGGTIFADRSLVITQPSAGEFKAFTAVCTHQGCTVTGVGETISCECHGSQFSITDGSVVSPPAEQPLQVYEVSVSGDTVTVQS